MTHEEAVRHLKNMKWLKGYSNTTVDGVPLDNVIDDIIALLRAQEQRHRLEVHNIGNVDMPECVSEEQFYAVMNNVIAALEHTDKGESWPYDEEGR